VGHFDGKYLAGDMLKAKCGAEIRVEVRDRVTGDVVDDGTLSHVHLEACSCAALDSQAAVVHLSMSVLSRTMLQQDHEQSDMRIACWPAAQFSIRLYWASTQPL